jgi:hypothetical protein
MHPIFFKEETMKHKFLLILVLASLLVASSGRASAQGPKPPAPTGNSGVLPKSLFLSPSSAGNNKDAVLPAENSANLLVVPALINGDFELGKVGWSETSSNNASVIDIWDGVPTTSHSGIWMAYLGGLDLEISTISQSFTIASPTNLRLWYWIGSEDDCGFDYGYVKINSTVVYTWDLCYTTITNDWVPLDIDLTTYTGQTVNLSIEAETDGSLISDFLIDDVSLYTFQDVPPDYWSSSFIERLYGAGVTNGCNTLPMMYCPTSTVTRDQMAIFLLRGKHGSSYTPPIPTGVFTDVPTNYWSAAWIEQLAAEGITLGCSVSPKQYCPTTSVTRDQMAVFLLRAKYGSSYVPPKATGIFQDVPPNHWAADWIEQLAAEGITSGCSVSPKLYCPATPVTRDQMAVFLVRNFSLP